MLEQEKSSCTVNVQSGINQGVLFFSDGDLIDAENGQTSGIEAAYAIVSWEDTSIALGNPVERNRNIDYPLGYILLNAAKQQDEQQDQLQSEGFSSPSPVTYLLDDMENDTSYQRAVTILSTITAVRHFYLLNKSGKLVLHSAPNAALSELIIYFIITSSNLSKTLQTKSPKRIVLQMNNGCSLLILPLDGKIVALVLESDNSPDEIVKKLRSELLQK